MTFDAKIGDVTLVLPDSLKASLKMPDPSLPGPSPAWVAFMGIPYEPRDATINDKRTFISALGKAVWVYRCSDIIATNALQPVLKLYSGTKKDRTEIEEHPILDLLDTVNPFSMDGGDLTRAMFYTLAVRGENYLEVVRNRAGLPAELYWRHPDAMIPIPDAKTFVKGYKYNTGRGMVNFAPEDVYWWRKFNPMNEYSGLSPLEALRQSVNIDVSAMTVQQSMYKNGGLARGIISPEMNRDGVPLPSGEVQKLRDDWRERMSGSQNAHSIAFMGAPVKFQDLSLSADAANWIETRANARLEVCAAYGIPLELATSETKSYDNLRSARLSFWQETEIPWLQWAADKWNKTLVREFDPDGSQNLHVEYDLSEVAALLPDWTDQETAFNAEVANGRATINEIRKRQGKEPLEWGDGFWAPWSVVDLSKTGGEGPLAMSGTGGGARPPEAAPIAEDPNKPKPDEEGDKPKPKDEPKSKGASRVIHTPEQRIAMGRAHAAAINKTAAVLTENVRAAFARQEAAIIARMPSKRKQITDVESLLVPAFADLMAAGAIAMQSAGETAYDIINDAVDKASAKGAKATAVRVQFRLDNPNLQTLVKKLGQRITEIDAHTLDDVRTVIGEGLRRGYSVSQIVDGLAKENYSGIRGLYEETYRGRSETIARTETSWVFNRTSVAAMRDSQVVHEKEWMLGIGDAEGHCDALDGEVVPVDEEFSDGSFAPPDPHPNCTCSILPVVNVDAIAASEDDEGKDNADTVLLKARALLERVA